MERRDILETKQVQFFVRSERGVGLSETTAPDKNGLLVC